MNKTTTNKPVSTIRDGSLKATVWANPGEDGRTFYSVRLTRTYRDEQGNYHDSDRFTGAELLRVARLAGLAYDETSRLRQSETPAENGA